MMVFYSRSRNLFNGVIFAIYIVKIQTVYSKTGKRYSKNGFFAERSIGCYEEAQKEGSDR